MHDDQRKWIRDLQQVYPQAFVRPARVIELGSLNVNGSARSLFDVDDYVGVDTQEGACVDVVCAAKDFAAQPCDTLISLSMLEHDPSWRDSLQNSNSLLRPGGLLILSYGAEGNDPHEPFPFVELQDAEVQQVLLEIGYEIQDAFRESDRYSNEIPGCYDLVGRKPDA